MAIAVDALLHDWVAKPADDAVIRESATQQARLLASAYIRAGFHVILHGAFTRGGLRDEAGLAQTLALLATIPRVHVLRTHVGLDVGMDGGMDGGTEAAEGAATIALGHPPIDPRRAAERIWEALPPDV